jgi:hypothetical protein
MTLLRQKVSVLVAGVAVVGALVTTGRLTLPVLAMPDRIHAAGYTITLGKPTPAPVANPAAAPAPAVIGSDERQRWAVDLLARLGNTAPTAETVKFVVAWSIAEDACLTGCGYSSAFERHNPLNTTQTGYGEYMTINGDGVKAYPDRDSGLAATVQTLTNGYYPHIVAGLQSNQPDMALNYAELGVWGTGGANVDTIYHGN